MLASACTTNTNADDAAPVPPEGATVFEARLPRPGSDGRILAYVTPDNEVQAGQELAVTIVTNQCPTPLLTMLRIPEGSTLNWFAEEAAAGETLTVAIPEDFQLGRYALTLHCIETIQESAYIDIEVIAAQDEPVEVTDNNQPANYCPSAQDATTTDCDKQTPLPTEEM